ncbi:hypothetical protein ACKWTF_013683 [Chironomus riparius]
MMLSNKSTIVKDKYGYGLCLTNCSSNCNGVIIYENDEIRRQKIKDCLPITIPDIFQICSNCDGKLNCFYQFRLDSVRCQHEFNDILKSVQPPQNVQYEQEYYIPMNEQNMYIQHPTQTNELQEDYHYMAHELHLALEDNQNDNNSLISLPANIYEQMQTPNNSEHHIHNEEFDQTSQLIDNQPQEIIEVPKIESPEHCVISIEQQNNDQSENILHNDDFTYDDFDESCQSFPSDRNNIDNAIEKKIEEFIQNKRNKANPKICTVCNKLFRTNYKLREHMQTHENNPKFICNYPDCNKSFKSKIGLKEHAAKHTGQYSYSCETCDKKFLLRSYYLAHQKIHSNVKNFACSMCSKTFKNKQNLVNHENFHYGLKLFICEICQKSFTTKTNLDVHMKSSHTQVEQFECSVCKKYFKTRAYLKVHQKTHFKELQNYACKICSKTFIQLCDLKIHQKTHTNQKDFVCEVCGESFTRKDSLKLHVSSVHNKDCIFNCEFCQKTFTRKNSLNQHRKKCINSANAVKF